MIADYLAESCFVFYSVATAYFQAALIKQRQKENKPDFSEKWHTAWGIAYAVYVGIIIWAMNANAFYGIVAAGFIREIFFAPALNLWRKLDFFYFNPGGKSVIDRFIKTRKRYIAVYAVSFVLLICLQIIIKN